MKRPIRTAAVCVSWAAVSLACYPQSNVYSLSIYSGGVSYDPWSSCLLGSPPNCYGFESYSMWKDSAGLVIIDVGNEQKRGGTLHRYIDVHLGPITFPIELPAAGPPYRQSLLIKKLTWDPEVVRIGSGNNGQDGVGDNWPITWGDDGSFYTAFGDGPGFGGRAPKAYLTLGFAGIRGAPQNLQAEDIPSDADTPAGGGKAGIKASGVLMVDGVLYLFVRNYQVSGDYRHSRLAWSTNHARNWTWADWYFSDTFGCPEFVQFGPNYLGARDDSVYIASQDNNDAYEFAGHVVLARVPRSRVRERRAYSFFAGFNERGEPAWTDEMDRRKPVFSQFHGNQRISVAYNAPLQRYFLTASHRTGEATHNASLGVFEAPAPWGPWSVVYYDDHWSGDAPTYHHKFPTPWMSADGKTMWLLYSGLGSNNYCFCLRKATLDVAGRP